MRILYLWDVLFKFGNMAVYLTIFIELYKKIKYSFIADQSLCKDYKCRRQILHMVAIFSCDLRLMRDMMRDP